MKAFFYHRPAVASLLAINLAVFVLSLVMESGGYHLAPVLGLYYFDSYAFDYYQVVTHLFTHGGALHITFNMVALYSFGVVLESLWGAKRFLVFYAITGLGAAILHQAMQAYEVYQLVDTLTPGSDWGLPQGYLFGSQYQTLNHYYFVPVVGASGAIYGVLLAFGLLFPNAKMALIFLPIPVKAKYVIPVLMLVELFLGVKNFSFDNIAHFAHLGGALFGFILVKFWGSRIPPKGPFVSPKSGGRS